MSSQNNNSNRNSNNNNNNKQQNTNNNRQQYKQKYVIKGPQQENNNNENNNDKQVYYKQKQDDSEYQKNNNDDINKQQENNSNNNYQKQKNEYNNKQKNTQYKQINNNDASQSNDEINNQNSRQYQQQQKSNNNNNYKQQQYVQKYQQKESSNNNDNNQQQQKQQYKQKQSNFEKSNEQEQQQEQQGGGRHKNNQHNNNNNNNNSNNQNINNNKQNYQQKRPENNNNNNNNNNYNNSNKNRNNNNNNYDTNNNNQQQYNNNRNNNNNNRNNNNQRQQQQNNNQRGKKQKQKYSPFWNLKQVEKGLREKQLYEGIFIGNERTRRYGQVKCEDFELRVFLNTTEDQNRALHGQTVIFRLKSEEELQQMEEIRKFEKEKIEQKRLQQQMKKNGVTSMYKQIVEPEEIDDDIEPDEKEKLHKVGEVVYIKDQQEAYGKTIVGTISPFINASKEQEFREQQQQKDDNENNDGNGNNNKSKSRNEPMGYWLTPLNKKYPKMYIRQVTDREIFQIPLESLQKKYFQGKIINWNVYDFHPDFDLQGVIGQVGDIETECQALLSQNEIQEVDFTEETKEYLKQNFESKLDKHNEFIIPEEERKKRWDLTNETICTIDPETARDLDDALSIKKLSDDLYEVGVHIADVSYFVGEDTPLEKEAQLRTTSVYLVHRVIPMLPRILCENLCSLNPFVERLAFSIFFQINSKGEVQMGEETTRYGKSIIKSCAKTSYETAQKVIDGTYKNIQEVPEELKPKTEKDAQNWFENIKIMNTLAQKRRSIRLENGAITLIDKQKKKYTLDEHLWPVKYVLEERIESQFMIEEFMVLANMFAAKKVTDTDRKLAVIRRHGSPSIEKQKQFTTYVKKFCSDLDFDFSSNVALRESIEKFNLREDLNENSKIIINHGLVKLLETAEYVMTETSNSSTWFHYALSLDVYTHFTSPIRRYPDILSHRLLQKSLLYGEKMEEKVDVTSVKLFLDRCNDMKMNSKRVSDGCEKIFMCLYLKNNTVDCKAIVTGFGERSLGLLIPDYDIDKQILFSEFKSINAVKLEQIEDQQNVNKSQEDEQMKSELVITYNTVDDFGETQKGNLRLQLFSEIQVQLTATDKFPIDYKITIIMQDKSQRKVKFLLK